MIGFPFLVVLLFPRADFVLSPTTCSSVFVDIMLLVSSIVGIILPPFQCSQSTAERTAKVASFSRFSIADNLDWTAYLSMLSTSRSQLVGTLATFDAKLR